MTKAEKIESLLREVLPSLSDEDRRYVAEKLAAMTPEQAEAMRNA